MKITLRADDWFKLKFALPKSPDRHLVANALAIVEHWADNIEINIADVEAFNHAHTQTFYRRCRQTTDPVKLPAPRKTASALVGGLTRRQRNILRNMADRTKTYGSLPGPGYMSHRESEELFALGFPIQSESANGADPSGGRVYLPMCNIREVAKKKGIEL